MLTTRQVREKTKDVTRRLNWLNLKVGERLQGCEKCQGRKNGEPLIKLHVIEVVSVRREPLDKLLEVPPGPNLYTDYAIEEMRREGFPNMTPLEFVKMFRKSHKKCTQATPVTRIEFKYL